MVYSTFWSLAVEEHFYLLWPAVLLIVGVAPGRAAALALTAGAAMWRIADGHYNLVGRIQPLLRGVDHRTDYCLGVLFFGCLLAYAWRSPRLRRLLEKSVRSYWVFGVFAAQILLLRFRPKWYQSGVELLMGLLPLFTIADPNGFVSRVLEASLLTWIGRLSYSLYLWQQLFLPMSFAPQVIDFRVLRRGEEEMTRRTLDSMMLGGMWDVVGGGFHRYSVDERWLVPHFEKMLYDNALLASVYVHAARRFGDERYRRVADLTLDYVLRELALPGGGFASAQDADTDGVEGLTFTWAPGEGAPEELLEPFEHGRFVLRGELDEETRKRLHALREQRPKPLRDDNRARPVPLRRAWRRSARPGSSAAARRKRDPRKSVATDWLIASRPRERRRATGPASPHQDPPPATRPGSTAGAVAAAGRSPAARR